VRLDIRVGRSRGCSVRGRVKGERREEFKEANAWSKVLEMRMPVVRFVACEYWRKSW
jgi:hypothetical protein